jgi:endonuclease/exonuclease/phosphatase family metal-dependent hydrolase
MRTTTTPLAVVLLATTVSAACGAMHARSGLAPSPAGACRSTVSPVAFPPEQQPAITTVRWIAPDDRRHRDALDDWCAGVGPAVIAPAPRPGSAELPVEARLASPLASSDGLVVVTWNVNVGGGDVMGLVEQLRAGQFTGGHQVDRFVLLLQETYRSGPVVPTARRSRGFPRAIRPPATGLHGARPRMDVVELAASLGLSLYYAPAMRNGPGHETDEDRGSAILATEALSDLEAIELPFERQRRVALQATIHLDGGLGERHALRLTNVHLENRGSRWSLGLLAPVSRLAQATALMDRLPPDGASLLGGDLNTWFGSLEPAYRRLAMAFDRGLHVDRRPTFGGLLRLDHVFVRLPDGWEARTVRLDRFGSDHHPLLTHLRPSPATGTSVGTAAQAAGESSSASAGRTELTAR